MRTLIVVALVGPGARLVDGALRLVHGVTSTSLLLIAGVHPAAAGTSACWLRAMLPTPDGREPVATS